MSISLHSIRGGKIQLKAARVLLGMKGHKPSAWNMEVGQCMKAKGARPTNGGRNDTGFQRAFVECVAQARTKKGGTASLTSKGRGWLGGGGAAAE